MKDSDSLSWFSKLTVLLYKYGLDSPFDILSNPPGKLQWKFKCRKAVHFYWKAILEHEASSKSSLKYLNTTCNFGKTHNIWKSVGTCPREVRRAAIKSKLATGTYILQASRAKWNSNTSDICPMSKNSSEDLKHFLLECPAYDEIRAMYVPQYARMLNKVNVDHQPFIKSPELLITLIIDCTHPTLYRTFNNTKAPNIYQNLENLSRHYCFKLHHKRASSLEYHP
jgi:hypothetical protein